MMNWTASSAIYALALAERERRRRQRTIAADVIEWAAHEVTIVHPQRGRVAFVPYPYQRAFLACDAPRRIVLKARQVGFSQIFAVEALHTAITQSESMILFVSRNQDLAINLLRYCYQAYSGLRNPPPLTKENESEIGFANGSRIKSLPANRSTGRGFAARDVYLDEFAYAEYAEDIYQSISPAISQGGRLTIGSTPNGSGNLFHALYLSGDNFTRFCVPWHHCPAYYTPAEQATAVALDQSNWYLRERPKYTHTQWASEFGCDFVSSGLNLFRLTDIDAAALGALGEQAPRLGRRYCTTVDLGRRHDATVINTFDVTEMPYTRVAFERLEHIPYPLIQQRVEQQARTYPGDLWVESNGIGDPFIENLNVPALPFLTTARSKLQALQALQLLFEQGSIKAQWDNRERTALIAAAWDEPHTADEVMSLAIFASAMQAPQGWNAQALGSLSSGRRV